MQYTAALQMDSHIVFIRKNFSYITTWEKNLPSHKDQSDFKFEKWWYMAVNPASEIL